VRAVLLAAVVLAAIAAAQPSLASERRPTQHELETQLICPTCHTTLDQSTAPVARRMKAFVRTRIAAGATASEIKEELVDQFGESVLASPPRRGLNWLAWLLPIVGVLAGGAVLGVLAWRWSRRDRSTPLAAAVAGGASVAADPDLERRLDDELARFDG
jgi:cytochrome c-type biogenesis protein CcmH/NrfF